MMLLKSKSLNSSRMTETHRLLASQGLFGPYGEHRNQRVRSKGNPYRSRVLIYTRKKK